MHGSMSRSPKSYSIGGRSLDGLVWGKLGYQIAENPDQESVTCEKLSPRTQRFYRVEVRLSDWRRWKAGAVLAEDAFPYLSVVEREFLLTGAIPVEN